MHMQYLEPMCWTHTVQVQHEPHCCMCTRDGKVEGYMTHSLYQAWLPPPLRILVKKFRLASDDPCEFGSHL